MTETTAIIVSVISACGACGAGVWKYYNDSQQVNQVDTHEVMPAPSRPNTPIPNFEEIIAHQMEQRNSNSDTEIDIKITIHTENHEKE